MHLSSISTNPSFRERPNTVNDAELLKKLGRGFIWLGGGACVIQLLLSLPGVGSFSGLLLSLADTIGRLASTVGLGAVLLVLADISESLRGGRRP